MGLQRFPDDSHEYIAESAALASRELTSIFKGLRDSLALCGVTKEQVETITLKEAERIILEEIKREIAMTHPI